MNRAAQRAILAKRRGQGGFTLIELAVSLVAGLMVAMAVMGVSKEATNTFHEEIRVAGAEMGLRIAMERIRLDLQRAAFMGTGNLVGDPLIARQSSYVGTAPNLSNFTGASVPYSLLNLSGIALHPQGASVLNDAGEKSQITSTPNNLAPDSIDIGGNFSSSDEYAAKVMWGPQAGPGSCPAVATVAIALEMATPAGWRIRNAETAASTMPGYQPGIALQAAFHPGSSTTSQFLLRLTDSTGRYQYLLGATGGIGLTTCYDPPTASAMIYLSPFSTIWKTSDTGGLGGVGGFAAGLVTVSPLQVVRWDIQTPAQLAATAPTASAAYMYNQTGAGVNDPSDFLLTRSYLDFSNACSAGAPCPVDPLTTEVVAEYAVDMKFGLTVDSYLNPACSSFPCPTAAPQYPQNPLLNYALDAVIATNPYAAQTAVAYTPNIGPQRVRSVQVRLGMRSPFGDRGVTLAPEVLPAPASASYLYRYKLDATALHYQAATAFARVRESTTEVNLPNQARFYW